MTIATATAAAVHPTGVAAEASTPACAAVTPTPPTTRGTASPRKSLETMATSSRVASATPPPKGAATATTVASKDATTPRATTNRPEPASPQIGRMPTPQQAPHTTSPKGAVTSQTAKATATTATHAGATPLQTGRMPTSQQAPQTAAQKTWSSLFATQTNTNGRAKLHYEPPTMEGDRLLISATPEELAEGEAHWQNTLVGYFIGSRPPYHIVKARAEAIWKPTGGMEILTLPAGFYIFRFSLAEDRNRILEGGPWFIQNRLLLLKPWDQSTRLQRIDLSAIPVWVKIHDLPMAFWTPTLISRIASGIGVPLYMDQATTTRSRIAYARICVEVSAEHQLPSLIKFSINGDQDCVLRLEYDRRPPRCSMCSVFGHGDASCKFQPAKGKTEWIPKQGCTPTTNPDKEAHLPQAPTDAVRPTEADSTTAAPGPAQQGQQQQSTTKQTSPAPHIKNSPPKEHNRAASAPAAATTTTTTPPTAPELKRLKNSQTAIQGNSSQPILVMNRFQFLHTEVDHEEHNLTDQAGPSTVAMGKQPDSHL